MFPDESEQEFEELSRGTKDNYKASNELDEEQKLMESVVEHDENAIDDGKLMSDALNNGFSGFNPDMMFDSLKKDFSTAKHLYGERMLRIVSGYSPDYIKKNIKIPEFQRELQEKMDNKEEELKEKGLIDKDGTITEKGITLASLIMYTEELNNLTAKGLHGEKEIKKKNTGIGEKDEIRPFRKGDSYKNLDIQKSIKKAIKRGHDSIEKNDLRAIEKVDKGSVYVIYCIDSSGSMKGKKIEAAKKAGIALAYKMLDKKDKVAVVSFSTKIVETLPFTDNFMSILYNIAKIKASKETNMTGALNEAFIMFPKTNATKHIILLTDALPTIGKNPENEVLESISFLRNNGITVSLIGLNMDEKGEDFGKKITNISQGGFYRVKNLEDIDTIILEDYNRLG
jgi:Mg-chelatase subunit ChlD